MTGRGLRKRSPSAKSDRRADMIVESIIESKRRKIKAYPVNSNRASDLGNPCLRYHVLNRTRWEEKSLHDVGLQGIFDLGNDIEEIALRELAAAGLKVVEQQKPFNWPEYGITGHLDGLVILDGKAYPLEIKSCSPFVFDAIHTADDLKKGKYAYLRKYPVQLTLYMLMSNIERGVFLFKNKVTGAYKEIWLDLDYDLGEQALKRAEAINSHLAAGTVPDPIEYSEECDRCGFAHICNVDHIGKEVEIDTGELATMLDRLDALKPAVKEYEEIDDQVKKAVEGREKVLAGNWFVTGKFMERKSYDIPTDLKAQYEKITRYWKRQIRKAA
jgi:CRISPR/Cas system-associated exonuclease Cas4 (RecB family)